MHLYAYTSPNPSEVLPVLVLLLPKQFFFCLHREIFWIEGPTSSSRIITAKLDTGEGVALSSGPTSIVSNLNGTEGLAVDSVQQRVWWTTAGGLIESAGFDGTQRERLHGQSSPLTSIDVFEDFVYAVAPSLNSLLKVNKFARRGKKVLCTTHTWPHNVGDMHCIANTAHGIQCLVNTVYDIHCSVNTVYGIQCSVNTVHGIQCLVNTVYGIQCSVNTVHGIQCLVNASAGNTYIDCQGIS